MLPLDYGACLHRPWKVFMLKQQAQRTTVIALCNKAEQHPKQSNIRYCLQTKIFWNLCHKTKCYSHFWITNQRPVKKVDTNPLVFQGLFNDVQAKCFDHQFLYTDGSKDDHKVGCAVVSNFNIIKRRLPGQASIYTKLRAIQLALDVVNNSNKDKYVICVDSLSCLQAI